jgi:hypothetical protein
MLSAASEPRSKRNMYLRFGLRDSLLFVAGEEIKESRSDLRKARIVSNCRIAVFPQAFKDIVADLRPWSVENKFLEIGTMNAKVPLSHERGTKP